MSTSMVTFAPAVRIEDLYAEHRLGLVRLALLLVDDVQSAEDVVQDAFAQFVGKAHRLRDQQAALAYLRTSVVNGSRSALRRRRTARGYTPPHEPDRPDPSDLVVLADEHRQVIDALNQLAPRQREVLVLRYWTGLTEAEIADTLGISKGSVKSTASRGMDALEALLDGTKEAQR